MCKECKFYLQGVCMKDSDTKDPDSFRCSDFKEREYARRMYT